MQALLFDISGVLLDGPTAVPGAVEALNRALNSNLKVRLVTNTSRQTRDQIVKSLNSAGYNVSEELIYTAPIAAKDYARHHKLKPWCLVHKNLLPDMDHSAPEQANAVIIGDAEHDFDYDHLNQAFRLCLQGAPLIAIGENRYFRIQGEFFLDAGPFVKAIEFASGQQAVITGKPSTAFFQQVLDDLQVSADQAVMIGDDVMSDVQGALNSGMRAVLVKTGKYLAGDEHKISGQFTIQPDVLAAVNALDLG